MDLFAGIGGNSFNPPTSFYSHCSQSHYNRSFNGAVRRNQHEVNCRVEPSCPWWDNVAQLDALTPTTGTPAAALSIRLPLP